MTKNLPGHSVDYCSDYVSNAIICTCIFFKTIFFSCYFFKTIICTCIFFKTISFRCYFFKTIISCYSFYNLITRSRLHKYTFEAFFHLNYFIIRKFIKKFSLSFWEITSILVQKDNH